MHIMPTVIKWNELVECWIKDYKTSQKFERECTTVMSTREQDSEGATDRPGMLFVHHSMEYLVVLSVAA